MHSLFIVLVTAWQPIFIGKITIMIFLFIVTFGLICFQNCVCFFLLGGDRSDRRRQSSNSFSIPQWLRRNFFDCAVTFDVLDNCSNSAWLSSWQRDLCSLRHYLDPFWLQAASGTVQWPVLILKP